MSTPNPQEQDDLPLPYGWIKQFHEGHPFWVDTKADPPRSIWVHPYHDEQFLKEHPDIREKVGSNLGADGMLSPDTLDSTRRHSYHGPESDRMEGHPSSSAGPGPKSAGVPGAAPKRGFFGKLKDSMIGTKEEREAEKRRQAVLQEQRRQERERIRQEQAAARARYEQEQAQMYAQYSNRPPNGVYAPPFGYPQQNYGYPGRYGGRLGGGYGGYDDGFGGGFGGYGGGFGGRRRRHGFGGGAALPLVGGLAGGLILGDLLAGDGGDFGGDGGDFGGDGGGFF